MSLMEKIVEAYAPEEKVVEEKVEVEEKVVEDEVIEDEVVITEGKEEPDPEPELDENGNPIEKEEKIEIKEEKIEITLNDFKKEDYAELEKLGMKLDPKFEKYAKELLDDGFTPEQVNKLAKKSMANNPKKKELTTQEASDLLNEKLSRGAKKNYHENVKTVEEAFKDHPKYGKHLKDLTRDPQFMEMVNDLRGVLVPTGTVEHGAVKLREKTGKVLTGLAIDDAVNKYVEAQYGVTSKQKMVTVREEFAKRVPKEQRQEFYDMTDVFDPRLLKK